MKIVTFGFVILFYFVFCSPIFSADLNTVIIGVQKHYIGVKTLSANFVQVYQERSGKTIREAGKLCIKKPGRMRWDYTSPQNKLFLSDGRKTYFYVPADKRVTVESIKEGRDPRTPFLFLLGRSNFRKDFSRIELGSESSSQSGTVTLRLWPRVHIENLEELQIECNSSSFMLSRIVIIHATGDRSNFLISDMKENLPLADSLFSFAPPPNVRVDSFEK